MGLRIKQKYIKYIFFGLILFIVSIMNVSVDSRAGYTSISGIVSSYYEDGSYCAGGPAVAFIANDIGYVFTSFYPYDSEAAYYVYESGDGNQYDLKLIDYNEEMPYMQWEIVSGALDNSFFDMAIPYQGENCTLYYVGVDDEVYYASLSITLTDIEVTDEYYYNYLIFDVTSGEMTSFVSPGVVVDPSGKCVGFAFDGGVISFTTNEETFYSNGGNSDNGNGGDNTGNTGNGNGGDNTGNTGNGNGGDNTGNTDNGNGDETASEKKGIEKYWWVLVIGAVAGGGYYMSKKNQGNSSSSDSNSSSRDISLDGGPYNAASIPAPKIDNDIYAGVKSISPVTPQSSSPMSYSSSIQDIAPTAPATVSSASNNYKLQAVGGYMDGRVYPFDGREIIFGRDATASIRFPQDTKGVSRIHCKLFMQGGKVMLMDMGSTYGTYIEGRGKLTPQAPVELKVGDKFCIGEQKNSFILKL